MGNKAVILEDESGVCMVVVAELQRLGYDTYSAQSRDEYLICIEELDVSLAVVDVFMPGADALRPVLATKAMRPRLPTVIIAQSSSGQPRTMALSHGTDDELPGADYIAKQLQVRLDRYAKTDRSGDLETRVALSLN